MKYESLQQYATRHGKSYQRARMLAKRLLERGLGKIMDAGQLGAGSWVVRNDAPWVGDGQPNFAKKANKVNKP